MEEPEVEPEEDLVCFPRAPSGPALRPIKAEYEVPQSLGSDETLEEQPEAARSGCAPYANPVSIVKRQPWSTMTPRPAPAGVQSAPLHPLVL